MDREEVIAEDALLFVTDPVGVQHLLAALRARHHDEGHGRTLVALTRVRPSGFSPGFRGVALGRLLNLGRLAQPLLELLQPLPELAHHLGQATRAEDEQHNHEHDEQFARAHAEHETAIIGAWQISRNVSVSCGLIGSGTGITAASTEASTPSPPKSRWATPGTEAGAESPAGRAGEGAQRTVPLADHRAGHVPAWRSWGIFVQSPSFVSAPVAGRLAHGGSGPVPVSSCRSVGRCVR